MESKVVVITGASGGIGAALAARLGTQGHSIVLAARREKELKAAAKESGSQALPVVTDVTRRKDIEHLRDTALKKFGHVDVWVNNAGRGISRSVMELTDEDFDEMMSVNVKSVLYGMQAIVPHFQQRGSGHLINVSSFLGRVPLAPFRSAYSAAKHAVNALTANLRMDLRKDYPAIFVSLVMPGVVATDFARNALGASMSPGGPPPHYTIAVQTPEEVAGMIAGLIEKPAPELYTNPASYEMAQAYYRDVGAWESQAR
ncbi:MAG: SDR family oxidoreductase [Dehalococcoidia bacterium]|jgi:NADP-dependent 3-hydroxy acid dehydrogenase YdfG